MLLLFHKEQGRCQLKLCCRRFLVFLVWKFPWKTESRKHNHINHHQTKQLYFTSDWRWKSEIMQILMSRSGPTCSDLCSYTTVMFYIFIISVWGPDLIFLSLVCCADSFIIYPISIFTMVGFFFLALLHHIYTNTNSVVVQYLYHNRSQVLDFGCLLPVFVHKCFIKQF